jgi:hypothetical protein
MSVVCEPTYVEKLARRVKRCVDAPEDPEDQDIRKLLEEKLGQIPPTVAALAEAIENRPHLQALLSNLTGYTPSSWLLECELAEITARRAVFGIDPLPSTGEPVSRAFTGGLMGLCCSGGGIRSATFSLGILQALAELNLLRSFDYLSSVSGGGYIHQWLAAWLKRESQNGTGTAKTLQAFEKVNQQLTPPDPARDDPQPEPVRWLRRYSNYLTPQLGIFSSDTWVAVAIWLRNTLLNQVILLSGLFFLLLIPHLLAPPFPRAANLAPAPTPAMLAFAGRLAAAWLVLLVVVPTFFAARNLFTFSPRVADRSHLFDERGVQFFVVVPWLAWAALWTVLQDSVWFLPLAWLLFLIFGLAVTFGSGALGAYVSIHTIDDVKPPFWKWALAALGLASSAVAAATVGTAWTAGVRYLLVDFFPQRVTSIDPWRLALVLGPPLYLTAATVVLIVLVGLIGRPFYDPRREWLSRFTAWTGLYALAWLMVFGVSLVGRFFVEWLFQNHDAWKAISALGGWLGISAGGVLAGRSQKTKGNGEQDGAASTAMEYLAIVGPYVLILGLFVGLAWGADVTMAAAYHAGVGPMIALLAVPAVICLWLGWRVDINEFSMHAFYRNRLARCYLGASNTDRKPNPFTGFDDADAGIKVSHLKASQGYPGPYPIFCTALNLTVGEDLAWQERKAASFTFAPLYSGYHVDWTEAKGRRADLRFNSFVDTSTYAYPDGGMSMSTAVSLSGAAVSPNMGYHTNPATAFVLTLFNARLGWWSLNPRALEENGTKRASKPGSARPWPSPHFAVGHLVKELLGQTNDTSQYVYLSDGGHFDNMGLYELVRRGCRYIVICDGEEDGDLGFGGIAAAVRRCRMDFGVDINLDLRSLERPKDSMYGSRHVVVGTIRYPGACKDTGAPDQNDKKDDYGVVVYLKASLTGDEPVDVLSYKKEHPAFPYDSTKDQWFTESQFESYRTLGHHIARSTLQPARPDTLDCLRLDQRHDYFRSLKDIWYPPTPEMTLHQAMHAARYDQLLLRLRTDARLAGLLERLFNPGNGKWTEGRQDADVEYARGFASELLEFIWTVYADLNLVQPANLEHPHSRGWIGIFGKWSKVDAVQDGWSIYRDSYSPQFRLFARSQVNLP